MGTILNELDCRLTQVTRSPPLLHAWCRSRSKRRVGRNERPQIGQHSAESRERRPCFYQQLRSMEAFARIGTRNSMRIRGMMLRSDIRSSARNDFVFNGLVFPPVSPESSSEHHTRFHDGADVATAKTETGCCKSTSGPSFLAGCWHSSRSGADDRVTAESNKMWPVQRGAITIIAVDTKPSRLSVAETLGDTHTITPRFSPRFRRLQERAEITASMRSHARQGARFARTSRTPQDHADWS